jgi:hypothetical protein
MRKTIYESYKADEFFAYNTFERFMRNLPGTEFVQSREEEEIDYQIWNLKGVTLHYLNQQGISNHVQVKLFGNKKNISGVEKIILAEAERNND